MSQEIFARQIDGRLNDSHELRKRKESGVYDEVFLRVGPEIRHFRYYSQWGKWVRLQPVTTKAASNPLVSWYKDHVASGTAIVVAEEDDRGRHVKGYFRDWTSGNGWIGYDRNREDWRVADELSGLLQLSSLGRSQLGDGLSGQLQACLFGWDFHYQSLAFLTLHDWRLGNGESDQGGIVWSAHTPLGNGRDNGPGADYFGEAVSAWVPWRSANLIVLRRAAGLMTALHANEAPEQFVKSLSPVTVLTEPPAAAPAVIAVPAKKRIHMVLPRPSGLAHYTQDEGTDGWKEGLPISGKTIHRPQLILHPHLNMLLLVIRAGSELWSFQLDLEHGKAWSEGRSFGRQVIGNPALFLKQDYRDGTIYPTAVVREGTDSVQFYRYDLRYGRWSSAMF